LRHIQKCNLQSGLKVSTICPLSFSLVHTNIKIGEQSVWTDPKELRAFFDDIAQQKGFNPRTEEGWSFNLKQLLVIKVTSSLPFPNYPT